MATVNLEAQINATPGHVYEQLKDMRWPEALTNLITAVEVTAANTRECAIDGGGFLKETIIALDDETRRIAYTITESPFAMSHHSASLHAISDGDGTRLVWTTDVLPDEVGDTLGPALADSLATMAERIEKKA